MKYTLEKICTSLIRGPFGSALKKDFFVEPSEDTYKVYEQGNAIRKSKDYGQYYIDTKKYEELKRFEVRPYDFIMSCSGTIGELYQLPEGAERGVINQALLKITLNNDLVDYDYFSYVFRYNIANLEAKGSGIQNVASIKVLKEMEFEIPDLQTQKSIVAVLNKTNSIIKNREQELNSLDELIKARFVEVFGERGKVVPLTDYVWFQEGPGVRSVDFTENGTILLTGSNINNNEISFGYKSDRFISNDLAGGKYAHFICDKDDILVVSSAIAPEKFDKKVTIVKEDKKYCLNTGIIRFKPNLEVMTLGYFREFLKTDYFKHQVMAEMRGIAQMHFGPSHLKQMTILLPESIEQQIEFEKFVEQVDKSKVAVQKSLEETQKLFDSLMQEYFG